jgi:predicted glycoside hydrolase/deacetylase ChbG (UPF0249 family)
MRDHPAPVRRILIVNADDFGHSAGVNAGVIKAHEQGIVTSASLMVRFDAAPAAAAYGRDSALSLGLHVDLGEWTWRDGDWAELYHVVPFEDAVAVEAEVERQLARFRELVGGDPTHLDSHQHVHTSDPAADILVALAGKLGVPLRHSGQIRYCGDLYGQTSTGEPAWEAISVDNLVDIVRRIEPGITELTCHPGEGADIESPYRHEREAELKALCDVRVRDAIREEGILLRSFADVGGPSAGVGDEAGRPTR